MSATKRKVASAIAAVGVAAAVALGGTFAWQSISQTALNEASDVVNPGGRLHDDFDGANKDVYVENFADEPIFARIRLAEYFEIVMNKGTSAEKPEVITHYLKDGKEAPSVKGDFATYQTHLFGGPDAGGAALNATDAWWSWETGGSTVYMPTFNKNKDSLAADVNGTYAGPDGTDGVNKDDDEDRYGDYVKYGLDEEKTAKAVYDADANSVEEKQGDAGYEGSFAEKEETHVAKQTGDATLKSMAEWRDMVKDDGGYEVAKHGSYWVYDTDGWVYWAQAIPGRNEDGTTNATGLLLDSIELKGVMDDSWYYAINVVGQFITADDLGEPGTADGGAPGTGFYADGETVSPEALELLAAIGVEVAQSDTSFETSDDGAAMSYALLQDDGSGSGYALSLVRSYEEVDTHDTYEGSPIIAVYKGADAPEYGLYSLMNEWATYSKVSSVSIDNSLYPGESLEDYFSYLEGLRTVEGFKKIQSSKVTNVESLFNGCSSLSEIDLSDLDLGGVTTMALMFKGCSSLSEIDLSGLDLGGVTTMEKAFEDCSALSSVTFPEKVGGGGSLKSLNGVFTRCSKLASVDLDGFDLSGLEDFSYAFFECTGIEEVGGEGSQVDLGSLAKAVNLKKIQASFRDCTSLKSADLGFLRISSLTNISELFQGCTALATVDISGLDTSSVTLMRSVFEGCSILENLNLGDGWNTSSVTSVDRMFKDCSKLELDCSGWSSDAAANNCYYFNYGAPGVTPPPAWEES